MRALTFFAAFLTVMQAGSAQTAANAGPSLPKDPREVFAAAAHMYDFSDPSLKPWHLKASYQLYDDKGDPAEQGTFEYWWVSPQVYRTTWMRADSTQTTWHTGEGKHAYKATGEPLKYFEHKLASALLSPLPNDSELDPAKSRLERDTVSLGDVKFPCIMVEPIMAQPGKIVQTPLGLFPTYCFDTQLPVLRFSYSMGNVIEEFAKIAKVQNRYLPRELVFLDGPRKILSATVDAVTGLAADDAALTPPPDIAVSDEKKVNVSGAVAQGMLLKKQYPIYPQDAKDAHVSGRVILQATIGTDGAIHDLHVISAPWPSLAASALWCVSHWQYKPYLLNGEPVEVETTINVIYTLGN
jgi:TonB family protein